MCPTKLNDEEFSGKAETETTNHTVEKVLPPESVPEKNTLA